MARARPPPLICERHRWIAFSSPMFAPACMASDDVLSDVFDRHARRGSSSIAEPPPETSTSAHRPRRGCGRARASRPCAAASSAGIGCPLRRTSSPASGASSLAITRPRATSRVSTAAAAMARAALPNATPSRADRARLVPSRLRAPCNASARPRRSQRARGRPRGPAQERGRSRPPIMGPAHRRCSALNRRRRSIAGPRGGSG